MVSTHTNEATATNYAAAGDTILGRSSVSEHEDSIAQQPAQNIDPLVIIQTPAAREELDAWKGWVELESEPAFFNVMLRDLGVEGVKVQEVFSLDDDMLATIPAPIYGLIFLFQFVEDDPTHQETCCPDHIWFANQTTNNACATIAILNIIMNAADVQIGHTLDSLRTFSADMTPALRGYTVGNHEFIRTVHNSFARKMDMLSADLSMRDDVKSTKSKRTTKPYNNERINASEAGFHFVAFVPIHGTLWKLDGLERQPMNMGECPEDDWVPIVKPLIEERMSQYENDQIQFNLLAVCKSPLATVKPQLCTTIHTLLAIQTALNKRYPDWESLIPEDDKHRFLKGADEQYDITTRDMDSSSVSPGVSHELTGLVPKTRLLELHHDYAVEQKMLKQALLDERAQMLDDDETAAARRFDLTPLMNTWLCALAESGNLEQLAERHLY